MVLRVAGCDLEENLKRKIAGSNCTVAIHQASIRCFFSKASDVVVVVFFSENNLPSGNSA